MILLWFCSYQDIILYWNPVHLGTITWRVRSFELLPPLSDGSELDLSEEKQEKMSSLLLDRLRYHYPDDACEFMILFIIIIYAYACTMHLIINAILRYGGGVYRSASTVFYLFLPRGRNI